MRFVDFLRQLNKILITFFKHRRKQNNNSVWSNNIWPQLIFLKKAES